LGVGGGMFYAACLCSFVLFHAYYDIAYCIYALKSVIKLCMTHVETAQSLNSQSTHPFLPPSRRLSLHWR